MTVLAGLFAAQRRDWSLDAQAEVSRATPPARPSFGSATMHNPLARAKSWSGRTPRDCPFGTARCTLSSQTTALSTSTTWTVRSRRSGASSARTGRCFVSVPDATTLTDKLYRWLARGGGHVNAFKAADEVGAAISAANGLVHVATRTLCSSLSFLHRHNAPKPRPRRLLLLGGGATWTLLLYTWLSRRIDRFLNTRTSVYGWAL